MKGIKKITSVILVSAMVLSLAACSGSKDKEAVVDATDSFASAVVKHDSKKVLKASNMKEKNLDESLFEYDDKNDEDSIILAILDNTSYEIDEESAEVSSKDKEASIDVVFKVPDYDKVFDETSATDADALIKEIKDADTKDVKVTVELELEDDEWKVSNAEKVMDKTLGEIKNAELPTLVNFDDLELTWWGEDEADGKEATYSNTNYIELDLSGLEDSSKVHYTVEFEGEIVYESDMWETYGSYSEYEGAELDEYGCLPVGDYTITFYIGNVKLDPYVAHVVEAELDYSWYYEDSEDGAEAWYEDATAIEIDMYSFNSSDIRYTIALDGKIIYESEDGESWAVWSETYGAELVDGYIVAGDYEFTFYVNDKAISPTFVAHVTNTSDSSGFGMDDEMVQFLNDDFEYLVEGVAWFDADNKPMKSYYYDEDTDTITYVVKFMDETEGNVYFAFYYSEDTTVEPDLDGKPVADGVKDVYEYIDADGNRYCCVMLTCSAKNGKYTLILAEDDTLETKYLVSGCIVGAAG